MVSESVSGSLNVSIVQAFLQGEVDIRGLADWAAGRARLVRCVLHSAPAVGSRFCRDGVKAAATLWSLHTILGPA